MPQVSGLYRMTYGSEITRCPYDYDSNTLGELTFKSPIPYLQKYITEQVAPPDRLLYEALFLRREALGAYVANNSYLMTVLPNSIIATSWIDDNIYAYDVNVQFAQRQLVPIGFTRTIIHSMDVTITPYKFFYDPVAKLAFHKMKWFSLPEEPEACVDMSLYRTLIDEGGECIYKTKSGGRRIL